MVEREINVYNPLSISNNVLVVSFSFIQEILISDVLQFQIFKMIYNVRYFALDLDTNCARVFARNCNAVKKA